MIHLRSVYDRPQNYTVYYEPIRDESDAGEFTF